MTAEDYDDLIAFASRAPQTEAEVAALARLAGGGRVLELGVGTGRVAIPLARAGIDVHGLDRDPDMLTALRAKPGGDLVTCHHGDMADVDIDIDADLIIAMFGTFFALPDQATQVRCFRNVASRLRPGGRFVIEALMPRQGSIDVERSVSPAGMDADRVVLNIIEKDPVAQTIDNRQLVITETGITFNPVRVRYCWPSELDLMAQLAGMRLHDRWSDWNCTPFTTGTPRHISVYATHS